MACGTYTITHLKTGLFYIGSTGNYKKRQCQHLYYMRKKVREKLPEGKLYVEDNMSTQWHRHVQQHGPKPEAYARYTYALIMLEELLCKK